MPEGFLQDESIGVKWKLYAIINGFWIGGKTCFGGNEFFAAKLGVSERQIRNGLSQLEEDGYIERVISGNSRVIRPKAHVVEAEVSLPRGGSQSSAEAEVPLPHISVSISESINTAKPSAFAPLLIEEKTNMDGDVLVRAEKDDKLAKYEGLCLWAEERRGFNFVNRKKQYAALKKARLGGVDIASLKSRWEKCESEEWRDGFDWTSVVSSFDKRA